MGKTTFYGAVFYIVAAVQFVVCMLVTASRYGPPAYEPATDTISDLQAVSCGTFQGAQVCSPLHALANLSVAVLGLLIIVGSLSLRPAFPRRPPQGLRGRAPSGRGSRCFCERLHPRGRDPDGRHGHGARRLPRSELRPNPNREDHVGGASVARISAFYPSSGDGRYCRAYPRRLRSGNGDRDRRNRVADCRTNPSLGSCNRFSFDPQT